MLSGKCERLLTGWAVAAAGFTADALLAQSAKHQAPVEVTTPSVPIPVTADGKQFLVYELHVTNFGTTPLALRSVEVYAGGATASLITTLRDSALHAAVRVIGAPTSMNGGAMTTRITRLNGEVQQHWPPYEIVIVGLSGRQFTTSGGVAVRADCVAGPKLTLDTLIVPGGAGLRRPGVADKAAAWIGAQAPRTRRVASVCTGIYGIAPTGLLNGRSVTTHWAATQDLQRKFPALRVDANALFIRDGKYYTSAGVTAGIDLALALIEEDEGPSATLAVARELVVYLKRPGGQSQFSEPLQFQVAATDRFRDVTAWIHSHLRSDLSVETPAARVFLSPRQFARAFRQEVGTTPAAFVEEARLADASRRLVESNRRVGLERIAASVGYSSADVFCRAFERRFGTTPSAYRNRFALTPQCRRAGDRVQGPVDREPS